MTFRRLHVFRVPICLNLAKKTPVSPKVLGYRQGGKERVPYPVIVLHIALSFKMFLNLEFHHFST